MASAGPSALWVSLYGGFFKVTVPYWPSSVPHIPPPYVPWVTGTIGVMWGSCFSSSFPWFSLCFSIVALLRTWLGQRSCSFCGENCFWLLCTPKNKVKGRDSGNCDTYPLLKCSPLRECHALVAHIEETGFWDRIYFLKEKRNNKLLLRKQGDRICLKLMLIAKLGYFKRSTCMKKSRGRIRLRSRKQRATIYILIPLYLQIYILY